MEIFLRKLKNVTSGLRGTVCTKYTVPVTAVDGYFPRKLKNVTSDVRGTVYTKCVNTVPVTVVDGEFSLNLTVNVTRCESGL